MSETKRPLTGQEMDQALRVEAMRQHRAQQASALPQPGASAAGSSAATPAATNDDTIDPAKCARVKVRGTKDNDATEEVLSVWERGVHADAAVNGGVVPPKVSGRSENAAVRLKDEPGPLPPPGDTETELNGLIAECRFLMREIAFNSARLTYDPDDRIRFLSAAQSMALTAAKIGKTVAQLRGAGGASAVETHRHEMIYTHVHSTPSLPPSQADS
jgi:hypothetical protein